jgi:hypothetical protein
VIGHGLAAPRVLPDVDVDGTVVRTDAALDAPYGFRDHLTLGQRATPRRFSSGEFLKPSHEGSSTQCAPIMYLPLPPWGDRAAVAGARRVQVLVDQSRSDECRPALPHPILERLGFRAVGRVRLLADRSAPLASRASAARDLKVAPQHE